MSCWKGGDETNKGYLGVIGVTNHVEFVIKFSKIIAVKVIDNTTAELKQAATAFSASQSSAQIIKIQKSKIIEWQWRGWCFISRLS